MQVARVKEQVEQRPPETGSTYWLVGSKGV